MSSWPYPYCPHRAFDKNLQMRLAAIPYTFVPDPTIDAFTNVNVKCANLDKRNIPTLAYQKYTSYAPETVADTNFARDYYKQVKDLNLIKMDNELVEETKEEMSKQNAYVLAIEATEQYSKYEHGKKMALDNARRRAVSAWKMHCQNKKDKKIQDNIESSQWLKKLYRKLQQVAKHIVEGEGESLQEKQKMFLMSKSSLTASYLSKIKVKNPQAAFDILQELRTLMLKKKMKFQNQRQQQQKNKSVSMSYTSEASQNTSQGSMMSEATSMNESNIDGQSQIVGKYCDFDQLAKKWGLSDIEDVKKLLRLILTRRIVSQAQLNAVKKKKQAQKMNQSLQKLNPQLCKKINAQKEAKKQKTLEKKNKSAQKSKNIQQNNNSVTGALKQIKMNKQDQSVKDKLLQGGQFDAIGEKFSRNRNYSHLFAKRQKEILIDFSLKKQSQKATPSNRSTKQPFTSTFAP